VDALDGVSAGEGEQGGVGTDADEAETEVRVSARGRGVGSEDACGETCLLGSGQHALQRILEYRRARVAGHAEIVREVAGADEQYVDTGPGTLAISSSRSTASLLSICTIPRTRSFAVSSRSGCRPNP
jgi:hypothetical protein